MIRSSCVVLVLCLALAAAGEDVPAFTVRPSAEIAPLIPDVIANPTAEAIPVEAPQPKLNADTVALLPGDDRDACEEARIWEQGLDLGLPVTADQLERIEACRESVRTRLDFLGNAITKLEEKMDQPASKLWSTSEMRKEIPLGTGALVFDVEQCRGMTATSGPAADKCAKLLQSVALQAKRIVAANATTNEAPEFGEAPKAKAPVSFAQSWESIVINSLADQMVVQLQGVASQKLLGVFGDTLCRQNVATYFPETCNLLVTPAGGTTNVRLRINQLPTEFQRTLRNDLVTLLPAVLQMANINDNAVVAFMPLLLQARAAKSDADWINVLAAYRCPAQRDDRMCATLALVTAGAAAYRDHEGAFAQTLRDAPAVQQWATAHNVDLAKVDLDGLKTRFKTAKETASKGDAVAKARVAISLWRETLTQFSPANDVDVSVDARLNQLAALDHALTRWGSVGRTVYRIADGFRKGYDPLVLSIDAAKQTECIDDTDLGCTIQFAGVAVTAFREVADAHKDDVLTTTDQTTLLVTITQEMKTKIAAAVASNAHVQTLWTSRVEQHFDELTGEAGPPLLDLYRDINDARQISANTSLATTERDEQLKKLYAQMIDTTFDVWRITAGRTVPAEDRARVERLVSNTQITWRAARERNYLTLAGSLYSLSLDLGIGKPLPESAERYRLLLTNLASAESQDQFKTAIDTYLSQSAASISKFDHAGSITLSGLPGVSLGQPDQAKTSTTVFAPVGVDGFIRFREGTRYSKILSGVGVFASVLDLGNLVSAKYEKSDDTTQDVENSTRFRDVFAPGLFLRMPIGQSGFSLGLGRSRMPLDTASDDREYRWKNSLFLAYDMSWFTFWRRQ